MKNIPLLLLIVMWGNSYCQNTATLRGSVLDSSDGENIPYANVYIEEVKRGASADIIGNFIITSLPAGKEITARVTHIGYVAKRLKIKLNSGELRQVKIEIIPSRLMLQEIETTAKRISKEKEFDIGLHRITIKELEALPKGVETDVMRSLQYLPGVKSSGDISARYYVRGGSSDQNLVLLNGVSIYNPFHAMGLFSVIDPEMINAVEFYKGGFTAEYGGRLSSILNVITKNGNSNRYAGSANLSFLTGKAAVEGPVADGSFIATFRKSLFDNVLKKFTNYKDAPFDFYDASFKANYSSSSEKKLTRISLFGFSSRDDLNNKSNLRENFKWTNLAAGLNWFQAWESPLYSELSLSVSKFDANVTPNQSNALPRENRVEDITLRMDFTYVYNSMDELKLGYYVKSLKAGLIYTNSNNIKTVVDDFNVDISVYAKYRLLRFYSFIADAGFRVKLQTIAEKNNTRFEPRLNMKYNAGKVLSLKGAVGIYSQEMVTMTDDNDVVVLFEPWICIPDYLAAPSAIHYVCGADIFFSNNLSLNIEAYYKQLRNLTELNKNKATADDPDLVSGSGKSYGWEFMFLYQDESITASCAYSLAWAYRNLNRWKYYPKYDSRHQVITSLNYNFGNDWSASAVWLFSSGQPFTQINGFYDKLYFDNPYYHWFLYESYYPYTITADRNLGRLPYYHRLDINLTKQLRLFEANVSVSGSIINVYDRKNLFYFERKTGRRINMLPFLPSVSLKIDL